MESKGSDAIKVTSQCKLRVPCLPQCIFIVCYLLKKQKIPIYLVQNGGEKLYFSINSYCFIIKLSLFCNFQNNIIFKQITKSIGKISNMSTMVFFEEI